MRATKELKLHIVHRLPKINRHIECTKRRVMGRSDMAFDKHCLNRWRHRKAVAEQTITWIEAVAIANLRGEVKPNQPFPTKMICDAIKSKSRINPELEML